MKSTRQIVVAKHDGTLERFSLAKLTNCLTNVLTRVGHDPRLAAPLARAVALHLGDWRAASPPTTGYVYRCVCSVLEHTGLGRAADELTSHRQQRRLRRLACRVVAAARPTRPGELWRKGAIVATLEEQYGLRPAVARFLAGRIESLVFALDYRAVSKTFLRELVHNEVLAWGLADDQTRCRAAGTPGPSVTSAQPYKENQEHLT